MKQDMEDASGLGAGSRYGCSFRVCRQFLDNGKNESSPNKHRLNRAALSRTILFSGNMVVYHLSDLTDSQHWYYGILPV